MTSPPGWVQSGAVADFDFVNQRYWQQGNPSGGISVTSGTPAYSANGLFVDGTFGMATAAMPINGLSGTLFAQTYQCSTSGAVCTLIAKNGSGGFLDLSATQTSIGVGPPYLELGASTNTIGSGNITTGVCKRVLSFDANGASISANGSTATAIVNGFPVVRFGIAFTPSPYINGYLQRVTLWTARLPDATLKLLST